jgi:hypothetical protein
MVKGMGKRRLRRIVLIGDELEYLNMVSYCGLENGTRGPMFEVG